MRTPAPWLLAALLAAACSRAADKTAAAAPAPTPAPAQAAAPPQPPEQPPRSADVMAQTFKGCRLEEVSGGGLKISSYACGPDQGNVRLAADPAPGGFALVDDAGRRTVVRTFAKAADAPVEAVLPAVLQATGKHMASCRLVEHKGGGDWGTTWVLEPTGAEKAAFDAARAKEPQDGPCGDLGVTDTGDRFFRPLAGDPTRVVWADMGSEIQVFDLNSLRPQR